jgi:hypothetical protein
MPNWFKVGLVSSAKTGEHKHSKNTARKIKLTFCLRERTPSNFFLINNFLLPSLS